MVVTYYTRHAKLEVRTQRKLFRQPWVATPIYSWQLIILLPRYNRDRENLSWKVMFLDFHTDLTL